MEDLFTLFFIVMAIGIAIMAALALTALAGSIAAICVFGAATHGFVVTMWHGVIHRGGATAAQGPSEPAFRAYYRTQVWRDLRTAGATGWKRAVEETARIQALQIVQGDGGLRVVFRVILLVYGYIGLVIGALLGVIVGIIPALLIVLVAAVALAIGAPLRAIERLRRKRRGTHFDCPECHDRFALPVYVCPLCSAKHHQLAPGPFGVLRHRCTCAARLPALQQLGRERLVSECPSGHLLGESVGIVRTFHVPVAGGPSTGKSTFLAAAMLGLEEAAADGTLSTSVQSSSRDGYERLLSGFRRGVLPTKTVELQAPAVVAEVRGKDRSALLYAYDVAGEAYGDEQELRRDPGYGLAEGVVLLVDPFALRRVQAEFGDELAADPGLRPSSEAPQRVLERLVGVLDEKGIDMSRVPAAICVTKCDGLGIGEAIARSPGGDDDARVRAWLEAQGAGNLLRSAEGTFKQTRCFSVSALGRSPGAGSGSFVPWGTLDPLLWLLTTAGVHPAEAGAAEQTQTQRLTGAKPLDVTPKRPLFAGTIGTIVPLSLAANFGLGLLAFGSLALASSPMTLRSGGSGSSTLADFNDGSGGGTSPPASSPPPAPSSPPAASPPAPPPPPSPAGGGSTGPKGPANSPTRVLRRHFQRLASGDYDGAFALMSSSYQARNPGWTNQPSMAQPYINVVEIGPSTVGTGTADVHIKFYARDRNDTEASDTLCRRFEGNAHLVKESGEWRYDPIDYRYSQAKLPPSLDVCNP
jgi:hypothetical protein